jgi:hypothetical protein
MQTIVGEQKHCPSVFGEPTLANNLDRQNLDPSPIIVRFNALGSLASFSVAGTPKAGSSS